MEQVERLKQMKAALVDFLVRAHEVPHLEKIVLFGSLLEGDVNKKSDIDLLLIFDTKSNPETGTELKMATKIGLEVLKNYQIENNFSFVVVNVQRPSKTDKDFLVEVASKGTVVWEKEGFDFLKGHRGIKPQIIFTYSTKGLSSANKRKLLRKIAKIVKVYGKRLGGGVILVENRHGEKVEKIFQECQANFKKQEIFS